VPAQRKGSVGASGWRTGSGRITGRPLWRATDELVARRVAIHVLPGRLSVPASLIAKQPLDQRKQDMRPYAEAEGPTSTSW